MANNRMALICNICEPKWETMPPKAGLILGKWYPGGGYANTSVTQERLNDFLIEHEHNGNEYPLRLEYECEPNPAKKIEEFKNI